MSGSDETTPGDDEDKGLVFRPSPLSPINDEPGDAEFSSDAQAGAYADRLAATAAPESADDDDPDLLPLGGEEVSLPWLEADEDDDETEGYDAGQFVSLVMLGLLALALIVGGIWWATRKSGDEELVADGSLVEAPEQAYKEKPKDPGGMTFEGTGDTSFAVSQGQDRVVRLGEGGAKAGAGAAAKPGFGSVGAGASGAAAASGAAKAGAGQSAGAGPATGAGATGAGAAGAAAATGGVGVQVGAFSTRKSAEEAWQKLSQRHSALSGARYRIVEGKADIGTVFRLQAVSADAEGARALCGKLKAGGLACQVKN